MSISSVLLAVALAGVANAVTPSGFQPSSTSDLVVAFGNTLATNGKNLPRDSTLTAPTIGTTEKLFGTYAVIMVDPDIPPQVAGGPTGQLLHWMQTGLESANSSTTLAGETVFELTNPTKVAAVAAYAAPNPPNRSPTTHRYTQLLVNTTGNSTVLSTLQQAGATRQNFSAANVVARAGVKVLFGNSFDVTNANASAATGTASGTARATTTASRTSSAGSGSASGTGVRGNGTATSTGRPISTGGAANLKSGSGAMIAGLGALAAAIVYL
ncbi:phosphatidylethanolamine-binding protein [Tricladium varicosporioides]|nr:phosphatidylethanolamine-binding protein [Hymenoscyphus varicosporioides]